MEKCDRKQLNYAIRLSKEYWSTGEAACYLCQLNPSEYLSFNGYGLPEISDPETQEVLDAILTLDLPYQPHPFIYIDTAIAKCLVELPEQLLSGATNIIQNLPAEQKATFINRYPNLAEKLDLSHKKISCSCSNTTTTKTTAPEKPLSENKLNSLLIMILAMAIDKYDYNPDSKRNSATGANSGSIKDAIEKTLGEEIDEETIREHLKEAIKKFPPIESKKSS